MVFTNKDKILVKVFRQYNSYSAKNLIDFLMIAFSSGPTGAED